MITPEDIKASLEAVNGWCHHYIIRKLVPHSCDTDGVKVVADVVASFCSSDFNSSTVTPSSWSGLQVQGSQVGRHIFIVLPRQDFVGFDHITVKSAIGQREEVQIF